MKNKRHTRFSNKVNQILEVPREVMEEVPKFTIISFDEMLIENYKGILECTDESVVIATGRCRIRFQGKHLHVEYYTNEEMKIEGMIQKILFL